MRRVVTSVCGSVTEQGEAVEVNPLPTRLLKGLDTVLGVDHDLDVCLLDACAGL